MFLNSCGGCGAAVPPVRTELNTRDHPDAHTQQAVAAPVRSAVSGRGRVHRHGQDRRVGQQGAAVGYGHLEARLPLQSGPLAARPGAAPPVAALLTGFVGSYVIPEPAQARAGPSFDAIVRRRIEGLLNG